MLTRRQILAFAAAGTASALATPILAAAPEPAKEPAKTFRFGWQKNGVPALTKRRGTLETRLAARGVAVTWHEFPSGPPLLEALGAGAIDFGYTGDIPPIFAQAGKLDLVYVGAAPAPGSSSAILVKKDGPIRSLADLKGRTLAFTKGSSAHNVAVSALRKAGLTLKDVTPAYLSPADAGAAFAGGRVEAWSIWDPFYAIAEQNPDVRVLTTAEGIVDSYGYYLANGAYTKANPTLVREVLAELAVQAAWSQDHLEETAKALSEITGVPYDVTLRSVKRTNTRFAVLPVTPEIVKTQQAIADTFAAEGLIPAKLDIASIVWTAPSI